MSKRLEKKPDIEAIIRQAVKEGIEAGRIQGEQTARDTYRATERRLYALPTLIKKVEEAKRRLDVLVNNGPGERSKDIVRFSRAGMRVSTEDIEEAMIADERAKIASDEYEIETIKKALKNIEKDNYYLAVEGRYFKGLSDDEIAKKVYCDSRTVRRHRSRLVQVLAVWLYGTQAV